MVMTTRRGAKVNRNDSGVSLNPAKPKWPRIRKPLKRRDELSAKFTARQEAKVKAAENARVKDDPENEDVFQSMLNSLANTSKETSCDEPSWHMPDSMGRFPSSEVYMYDPKTPPRVASASLLLGELPDTQYNWMDDVW